MKAYVTSVGEPTTELCVWSLERNGFEVELLQSDTSLWQKLNYIYKTADDDFLRVDADIVVNRNMTPDLLRSLDTSTVWWWQFLTFDWFKQDFNHAMAYMTKDCLPVVREGIDEFELSLRPETDTSRLSGLHNPRRLDTYTDKVMGLHGYGITDLSPVKKLKAKRGQYELYDFELAERLNAL